MSAFRSSRTADYNTPTASSVEAIAHEMADASASVSRSPPTIGNIPPLIDAMDRFASEHTGFESSTVGDLVRSDMAAAPNIYDAALVPLRHKIFSFEVALKWGFLLEKIIPRIISEHGFCISPPFDIIRYHTEIFTIYDTAVAAIRENCTGVDD